MDEVEILMDNFNHYLYETLDNETPYYNEIIYHLKENTGKQIRSKISLFCAKLGGELSERSYRAAMIVEMLHTASLLHDDIVDNSTERRGVPSINAKWGNKIALLSGDIISITALLLSLKNKDYDIFNVYSKAVEQIVKGEILQLKKTRGLNTKEDIYFEIIKAKTAAFFSAACEAGACTTFNNSIQVEQLKMFGENVGIAFQIRDDLFGFENLNVGKPTDNDFKEKKLTLPLIYVLNNIKRAKCRKLKRMIKKKIISAENIEYIINEVKQQGGIDYAIEKMRVFGQNALDILLTFPETNARRELEKIVKYTMDRSN
jgi:octaprenyl-diphosphate synthase